MITAESFFRSRPRIARERFVSVLSEHGSPWAGQAGELYDLIRANRHDPAVWLAIAGREHRFGAERASVLWRMGTNSWTNARSVRLPGLPHEIVSDPVRGGPYVRYRSVVDSLRDGMYRVDDPDYVYQRDGAHTIGQVLRLWTESDAAQYTAYVVARLNEWRGGEAMTFERFLTSFDDVRGQLATRALDDGPAGPFERLPLHEKRGLVVHYSGPPVTNRGDTLAVLQAEARYHVHKNWARAGDAPVYGDGLMYHVAIGADGKAYLYRDLEAVLWHCGVTYWNRVALSVHLPIGGDQQATAQQRNTLWEIVDGWRDCTGTPLEQVWGHRELSATSCPGTLMEDFIYPYRQGDSMADGRFFAETGHHIGGGFWQYWRDNGGLLLFGYPLSGEMQELCEDGQLHTVQYFERAVFEWHPQNDPPYQVLLRRLGDDAYKRRAA